MVAAPNPKSADQPATGTAHPEPKRMLIAVAILVIVSVIGLAYLFFSWTNTGSQASRLQVSGRIEGYETNIGPKIGGRVDQISHREGELVKRNELLVQISDDDIQAQLHGAEARIEKAKEQVEEAKYKIEQVQAETEASQLRVEQSKQDSQGRIRQWQSTVASDDAKVNEADASLAQARADSELARIRRSRYEFLVSKLAVTKDEYDQAVTNYETDRAVVNSRQASLEAARRVLKADEGQLEQAKSTSINPPIQSQELLSLRKQLAQAEHDLKSAEHEVTAAAAERDQILANIAYLKIVSPIDGVVTARVVEPGAVVVPGQTLLSLINLDTVYLRGYIPEGEIGNVKIGQKAKVMLDARPDKPLDGQVIQIDPQGSFTPENIYFKNERVKQVFGIKIAIHQPGWLAKPGMPADAEILLK